MGHDKQSREAYYQKLLAKCHTRHKIQKVDKQKEKIIQWEKLANYLKPKQ
jgi:hypothetical protein